MDQNAKLDPFVFLGVQLKGAIAPADTVRPQEKEAIEALKALDIRCMMLTGDKGDG